MLTLTCLTLTALAAGPQPVQLSTTPHRAHLIYVTLMTQEQLEAAPVEMLTLPQLQAENVRLSNPPTLAAPIGMIAGGGALLLIGALGTWGCVIGANQATDWDVLGWAFLGVLTAAVAIVGIVVAVVGSVLLATKSAQRAGYEERRALVRARMEAIATGQAAEPQPAPGETPQAQAELLHDEAEKPGFGLPLGLMIGGGAVGTYGIFIFTSKTSTGGSEKVSPTVLGIGAIVIALALEGIGIWQLISRINERAEIDAKAKQRFAPPPPPPGPGDVPPPPPPPPSAQLPAAPLFAAWAWSF